MAIKHKGNRRYDGSDPLYSKEGMPVRDLLRGLKHVRRGPITPPKEKK